MSAGNALTSRAASPPEPTPTLEKFEEWFSAHESWAIAATLLLAFAFRLKAAFGTYLNPDEALHHLLVNQTTLAGAYRASLTNAHPPLYFILLYYWRFIGNSEIMMRLPSILSSTAAAWMAFKWIDLVLGKTAAWVALFSLALSPVLTALGAEVRNYSLLLLCIVSTLYFWERAFRDRKVSSVVAGSLCLYLAILTHYSALWFVLAGGTYILLRISSLKPAARIAWLLFQLGGVAIYVWLYIVHISKLHGSPMESDAMTGWLQTVYFRPGDHVLAFASRATLDLFQFLFASRVGGGMALVMFAAGLTSLFAAAVHQRRRDLAAFGALLVMPFIFGMTAAILGVYPFGGTRHCLYLIPFATAGVSVLIAAVVRRRMLLVLALVALVAPYWNQNRLPDPLEMSRTDQRAEWMEGALRDLQGSVQPGEPIFADYQSSILLEYYLGRDRPPPPARMCGGVSEQQYGRYRIVVLNAWSATGQQLTKGRDDWREHCDSSPRESVWVFDAGWGKNILDEVTGSVPTLLSHPSRFGEAISFFRLRFEPQSH
ncbi:MAG: glycosyltransferase family 39 protein [Bryobacterales bacterium]|nr:glycosyltransferase family 39 protein [Bryobacterales bacterium]